MVQVWWSLRSWMRHNETQLHKDTTTQRDTTRHNVTRQDHGWGNGPCYSFCWCSYGACNKENVWWWSMKPQVYTEMAERKVRQMQVCAVGRLTKNLKRTNSLMNGLFHLFWSILGFPPTFALPHTIQHLKHCTVCNTQSSLRGCHRSSVPHVGTWGKAV